MQSVDVDNNYYWSPLQVQNVTPWKHWWNWLRMVKVNQLY